MLVPKSLNQSFQANYSIQSKFKQSKASNMLASTAINSLSETKLYKQYQSLIKKLNLTSSGQSFYNNNSNNSKFSQDKQNIPMPCVDNSKLKLQGYDLFETRRQEINCFLRKVMHQLNQSHHQIKNQKILYEREITQLEYQIHKQRKLNKELKKCIQSGQNQALKQEMEQLIFNLKNQIELTKLNDEQKIQQLTQFIQKKEQTIRNQNQKIRKLQQDKKKINSSFRRQQSLKETQSKEIAGLKKLIEQYQNSLREALSKIKQLQAKQKESENGRIQSNQKMRELNSQMIIIEAQLEKHRAQTKQLNQAIKVKDKYITHLTKNCNQVQKQVEKVNQITNHKYKQIELIAKDNTFLKEELDFSKRKIDQLMSLYQKNLQALKTEKRQRSQRVQRESQINEDKWRKLIAQEKEKCISTINKTKSSFKTKQRLLAKLFKRACNQMRQQLEKLKINNQKQMLVFAKLFSRDIKQLIQERQASNRL